MTLICIYGDCNAIRLFTPHFCSAFEIRLLVHSFLSKNVVFPAQAEYSYFSADFRLKIFLYYSLNIIAYDISVLEFIGGINYKCLVSGSVSRYIVHVLHRFSYQGQEVTSNNTWPFWL